MTGVVMRSTGSWYEVRTHQGVISCRMRGKFRLEGIKETNPVAVGDRVEVEIENNEGVIHQLLPRTNFIIRQSVKRAGHAHVIAANIEQALLMATVVKPRTSAGFIDRFITAAESFRIPQVLLFNKSDILDEEEKELQQQFMDCYSALGITCIALSALQKPAPEIVALLQGKTTLIAGHSGVGKSTFLNMLSPHIRQRVSDISSFSDKGMHTTTFAEMFELNPTTFIIDTPGLKEFGLVDMTAEELSDYFIEMRDLRLSCRFGSRCAHRNEPGCAIRQAVADGRIAESRYRSYVSILEGEDNRK